MDFKRFASLSIAFLGSNVDWQKRMARKLETELRFIHRWQERNRVPSWVDEWFVANERSASLKKLRDAEDQLHLLLTGQAARVFVDYNGVRVEYSATNVGRLRVYINELREALGMNNPQSPGPMRIWF